MGNVDVGAAMVLARLETNGVVDCDDADADAGVAWAGECIAVWDAAGEGAFDRVAVSCRLP